tara:strand:+ start:163 stop:342 length:180 start_codon:yes stop_codon:yes gene_type:complete
MFSEINNFHERVAHATEFINVSRRNDCTDEDILRLVSCGSGKNNVQSELVINLIKQELI